MDEIWKVVSSSIHNIAIETPMNGRNTVLDFAEEHLRRAIKTFAGNLQPW